MMKTVLLGIVMLFSSVVMGQSAYQHHHVLSPTTVTIGDPVAYSMRVTFNSQVEITPPAFENDQWGSFVIKDVLTSFETVGDQTVFNLDGVVSVYEIGDVTWPTVNLQGKLLGQDMAILFPALTLTINSVIQDVQPELKGLKPLMSLPLSWFSVLLLIVIVLLVIVGAGYGIYHYYFKTKQVEQAVKEVAVQVKDPFEIALEALHALKTAPTFSAEELKAYYFQLSDLVKRYLSALYGKPFVEMTTNEVLTAIEPLMEPTLASRIQTILTFCDQVKFAKFFPDEAQHHDYWSRTEDLLNRVRQQS